MAKQRIEYLAVDRLDIERTLVKGGVEVNLSGGGVTGFTPTQNTVAPNDSINASRLLVDVATPSGDAVLQPKGFGAVMAQLPDSTSTGGNKRGSYAVDWQTHRGTANDTLDCLAITATGGVGKSFRWLATIHVNKING
jgi:hypothetical protein